MKKQLTLKSLKADLDKSIDAINKRLDSLIVPVEQKTEAEPKQEEAIVTRAVKENNPQLLLDYTGFGLSEFIEKIVTEGTMNCYTPETLDSGSTCTGLFCYICPFHHKQTAIDFMNQVKPQPKTIHDYRRLVKRNQESEIVKQNKLRFFSDLIDIADVENREVNWKPKKEEKIYIITFARDEETSMLKSECWYFNALPSVPFKTKQGAKNAIAILGERFKELFT